MKQQEIESIVNKLKKRIAKKIDKEDYNEALSTISLCANILYTTNIQYKDSWLENQLEIISEKIININEYKQYNDILIFYDGFGLNDRGLAQIYLKGLCKYGKVVYITRKIYEDRIPTIIKTLENNNCKSVYLKCDRPTERICELNDIIKKYKPNKFVFYSIPNDVIATPIMFAYKGLIKRYQINLTDHAFWLGADCVDTCIEFREYGATISNKYRGIAKEKIAILPYYPNINTDYKFLGFPFEKKEKDFVVFSGGSIYKTISNDNQYYIMLEKLIINNPQVIIWFASNGTCSNLEVLINKYPNRIYHTKERKDLFQLLEHVDLFLNTYPLIGGLMFQYSAVAGKIPLTLSKNKDFSSGLLINQSNLNIIFDNMEDLLKEAKHIINDNNYRKNKNKMMKKSVINQAEFEQRLFLILDDKYTNRYKEEKLEIDEFKKLYLDRMNSHIFDKSIVSREGIKSVLLCCPFRFMHGTMLIVLEKLVKFKNDIMILFFF